MASPDFTTNNRGNTYAVSLDGVPVCTVRRTKLGWCAQSRDGRVSVYGMTRADTVNALIESLPQIDPPKG